LDIKNLAQRALKNRDKAYAPYSGFKVGAALVTSDGEIYDGANIENSSYGLTICAERVAAVRAISEGKRSFLTIAVACDDEGFCRPCGACRQFLAEFSPEMEIIMVNASGEWESSSLAKLLPFSFSLEGGKKNV
jgi:cytidine deaminase